jgi:hypothetical protein
MVILVPFDEFFRELYRLHFIDNQNFSILFLILAQQINFAVPNQKSY